MKQYEFPKISVHLRCQNHPQQQQEQKTPNNQKDKQNKTKNQTKTKENPNKKQEEKV